MMATRLARIRSVSAIAATRGMRTAGESEIRGPFQGRAGRDDGELQLSVHPAASTDILRSIVALSWLAPCKAPLRLPPEDGTADGDGAADGDDGAAEADGATVPNPKKQPRGKGQETRAAILKKIKAMTGDLGADAEPDEGADSHSDGQ